eukprot:TRINITY_DN5342_c0_g1_i10.p1 TRINITY_DN5342_c0_g1~~TRINITY_DN5342_c0_g1_i10.p1  ORF type:complete len:212 (+),score=74.19 TRINITY_DN5342_c0_g1_i10:80-715(+)
MPAKFPKVTLKYFDTTARGETIRLILVHAGQDFKDERLTFAEFGALKPSLPFNQFPVIEIEGEGTLAQHMTICRYLANRHNLTGHTLKAKAEADESVDALNDIVEKIIPIFLTPGDDAKRELVDKALPDLQARFKTLEKRLESRGGQFLAGNTLTWADLHLHHMVHNMLAKCLATEALASCPLLTNLNERVASLPNIKKWNADNLNRNKQF